MSGYADFIMDMSHKYSIEQILEYYETNTQLISRKPNMIKTIGVYYRRMYNGGVERVVSDLISIWISIGYKVVLFTDEEPNEKDYGYPDEVKRIVIPSPTSLRARLKKLEEAVQAQKIDVFVDNGWTSGTVIWELLVVKSMHIPFILYAHGHFTALYSYANEYSMNSARVLALCDKVIALSEMNVRFYELCGCNVIFIQNPISKGLQKIRFEHSLESDRHVLWIGRIGEGKRLDDALRMIARVRKNITDIELDVVGIGTDEDMDQAKLLCNELAIETVVHFHGYQADIDKYYRNAAVVLMTSEKEGYPMVLVESKAYGRTCVMYSLPYLFLTKGEKGIKTAQIGDIDKMAEHLCNVILDSRLRWELENESRASFDELCRYDLNAEWKKVLTEMEGPISKDRRKKSYDQDGMMITMLLESLRDGIKNGLEQSFEYQIGKKVLKYPRNILQHFRIIKNRVVGR